MSVMSSSLSPEDIETLQGRFSKLEADVDAFSTALTRLSNARRLSSSKGGDGGGASSTAARQRRQVRGLQRLDSPAPALAMIVLIGAAMSLILSKMRVYKVRRL